MESMMFASVLLHANATKWGEQCSQVLCLIKEMNNKKYPSIAYLLVKEHYWLEPSVDFYISKAPGSQRLHPHINKPN